MKNRKFLFALLLLCGVVVCIVSFKEKYRTNAPVPAEHSLRFILDSLKIPASKTEILIKKKEYTLSVVSGSKILKTYPCVFGGNPTDDKLYEGDNCTPEGVFHLRNKYPHKSWTYFMWIDYPTQDSWRKHKQAVKDGKIKADSGIGGEVGIHGVPEGADYLISTKYNWTLGCISLSTAGIKEVYSVVPVGAKITIIK